MPGIGGHAIAGIPHDDGELAYNTKVRRRKQEEADVRALASTLGRGRKMKDILERYNLERSTAGTLPSPVTAAEAHSKWTPATCAPASPPPTRHAPRRRL